MFSTFASPDSGLYVLFFRRRKNLSVQLLIFNDNTSVKHTDTNKLYFCKPQVYTSTLNDEEQTEKDEEEKDGKKTSFIN